MSNFEELSDDEFTKLKAKHHPAELFELCITDEDAAGNEEKLYLYVTKPSRGAFNIFSNAIIENEKVLSAAEQLVFSCVKHPEKPDVAKLLEDKKQYVSKILGQINKLEGSNGSVSVKKR